MTFKDRKADNPENKVVQAAIKGMQLLKHIDAAGYGAGERRPMDEDHALELAEAEIRRLKATVKALTALCDAARQTVVQHSGNKCLE